MTNIDAVRNNFVAMLDTAVAYAAENQLPVYDSYTIFSFYAQLQMNVLIEKRANVIAQESVNGAPGSEEIHPWQQAQSAASEGRSYVPYSRQFAGIIGAQGGMHYRDNELAREFSRGNCPDCQHGGPTKCPLSCPSKDFIDNPAPDNC